MDNVTEPRHPHPMQPVVIATDGVARFQKNAIVEHIVHCLCGRYPVPSYNQLMAMPWSDADRDHFHQLHGYSVSGLPYRDEELMRRADLAVEVLVSQTVSSSPQ